MADYYDHATPGDIIKAKKHFAYFLTIQSDAVGTLRFETEDGTQLTAEQPVSYIPDAHHGSLKSPVLLRPADECRPYKIIENDHVIIIRNNEKYNVTGQKL